MMVGDERCKNNHEFVALARCGWCARLVLVSEPERCKCDSADPAWICAATDCPSGCLMVADERAEM